MFSDNVIQNLYGKIPLDCLPAVKAAVEMELAKYDISPKKSELTVSYSDYPDAVKAYLVIRKIEGLSDNTLKLYEMILRQFFADIRIPICDISANDIRLFLYKYKEARDVGNQYLDLIRTVVSTFFSWAAAEGYILSDPGKSVKPIKYEKKPRKSLSEMDMEKVRDACKTTRDKAILELFYSTGCRVSEVINIKLEDVNFIKKTIVVTGKGKKTRTVYLNAKAIFSVNKYLSERNCESEYLFVSEREPHGKLSKAGMEKVIKRIGERSTIEKNIYCHLIRHTTATHGLRHGMDITQVQKMLGHSQIATTMIYTDVDDDNVQISHERAIV